MKKHLTLILVACLVAVCLPLTACNSTADPTELFYSEHEIEIFDNALSTVGLTKNDKNLLGKLSDSEKKPEALKLSADISLDKLELSGQTVLTKPLSLNLAGIANNSTKNFSALLDYSYDTDALKAHIISDSASGTYLSIDDINDKYFNLVSLMSQTAGEGGAEQFSQIPSDISEIDLNRITNELETIINSIVTADQLKTEKYELSVNGVSKNVDAVSYTKTGDELKAVYKSLYEKISASTVLKTEVTKLGEEVWNSLVEALNPDNAAMNDSSRVEFVKYFDGNTFAGLSLKLSHDNDTFEAKIGFISSKDADHAEANININGEDTTKTDIKLLYSNKDGKVDASVVIKNNTSISFNFNSETKTEDDKTVTAILVTAKSGEEKVIDSSVTLTVNRLDGDAIDVKADFSLSIKELMKASGSFGLNIETTTETPVLLSSVSVYSESETALVFQGTIVNAMLKIPATLEMLRPFLPVSGLVDEK